MRGLRVPSIASMKKGSIISTGTRAFMFKSIFPGIYNKWRYNEDLGCSLGACFIEQALEGLPVPVRVL